MRVLRSIGGICLAFFAVFLASSNPVHADILDSFDTLSTNLASPSWQALEEYNLDKEFDTNRINMYNPCDGASIKNTAIGSCAKLAELRTAMWNAASDEDKESFMGTVEAENHALSGVEGYMNQVLATTNGNLHEWLHGTKCSEFRGGKTCIGSHQITDQEQKWINKALSGSNVLNAATGNASVDANGHSASIGGPLTCLWIKKNNEDGGECYNIDYNTFPYNKTGSCEAYINAAGAPKNAECWGWDNTVNWSKSIKSQCGGNASVGSTVFEDSTLGTTTSSTSGVASSSVSWDSDGWITNGLNGYKKEPGPELNMKYNSGKPNKILLHYTQGTTDGLAAYSNKKFAAHFTIDLKKKTVSQHHPLSKPSGATKDSTDKMDIVQIEIVGYGFQEGNPTNPSEDSKCIIDNKDYTDSEYCFAKFTDSDWDYLAELMIAINNWGKQNGAEIPLTSSVKWTGDVNKVRLSKDKFKTTTGVVAHMHAPKPNTHNDTGNIWPMVKAAIERSDCNLSGNEDSISGAKNAEKQASEVGKMTFSDNNTNSMKKLLENYGDLAYRAGKAYGIPWLAILVQARYENSNGPGNNFWGIGGAGKYKKVANLGESFKMYGKTVHNGYYKEALKEKDPYNYLMKLAPMWVQGDANGAGYASKDGIKKSINALTKYTESEEGRQILAQFGATACDDNQVCSIDGSDGTGNNDVLQSVQDIIDLANKNGSTYPSDGHGGSTGGVRSISGFNKILNDGANVNVDCTGFASLVYYKTYGSAFKNSDIFSSSTILGGMPSYKEVKRSEVRPGDIFAYTGHGGIVVAVENGRVTKIAETGGKQGRSGSKNTNLGYSGPNDYSVRHMNTSAGHFYRWKGAD